MKNRSALALAFLLAAAAIVHFVSPKIYLKLIPSALPGSAELWVYGSGVGELACALAIAYPPTRAKGALAAVVLFVCIFPGNIKMALDAEGGIEKVITYARLPLQIPLILWALKVRRSATQALA